MEQTGMTTLFGGAAVVLSIIAYWPYIVHTVRGTNKPHIFSWIIWTLLTGIAFAGQLKGGAGAGAWPTAVACVLCATVMLLSFRHGEKIITRSDWIIFGLGLLAIPAWLLTSDPLWAVLISTGIYLLAFGPTVRKSWNDPHGEHSHIYTVNILRHIVSLAALGTFTLVTAVFPAALLAVNIAMVAMLAWRKHCLAPA